ncbi:MAG: hypothetical protein ABJD11_17920 [Gemmatimonadota bacterium]
MEYCIDEQDRICRVDEGWMAFARSNGGDLLRPDAVIGCRVTDFIADLTTREIYRTLYDRVRKGATCTVPFRCDSPALRRRLTLRLSPTSDALVRTESFLVAEEVRKMALPILDPTIPRSADKLMMCSWCLRVRLDGRWRELDDVRDDPRLGAVDQVPRTEYEICMSCLTSIYPGD